MKRGSRFAAAIAALAVGACSAPTEGPADARSSARATTLASRPPSAESSEPVASSSAGAAASARAEGPPRVSPARAASLLFEGEVPPAAGCGAPESEGHVRCLVAARYREHADASRDALALFDEMGDVAGLERETDMDGGFRGQIHLVPELPVGPYRKHLAWVLGAQRDIERFVTALSAKASRPLAYRHKALGFKFMRSVKRTTPSAYAQGWEVGYNVSGSLLGSARSVTETIFHEVFHLNDEAHRDWSRRSLGPIVDAIAKKCGTKIPCLTPYAPFKTMVRGGTYYAFQPNNGDIAHEYAAELATRYFEEQLAASRGERYPGGFFKCGPEENAKTMSALAEEFFAGVDLTPPCR